MGDRRIELAIAAVVQDQPVGAVEQGEAFGDRLDCLGELRACPCRLVAGEREAVGRRRQLAFAALVLGDVGVDRDHAAARQRPVADDQPLVAEQVLLAAAGIDMPALLQARVPGREVRTGLGEHADLEARTDDGLEGHARLDEMLAAAEEVAVDAVAHHQTVVLVPHHEALGRGFDGGLQPGFGLRQRLGQALVVGDVAGRADEADGAAAGVAHGDAVLARPAPASVAGAIAHLAFEARRGAAQVLAHAFLEGRQIVEVDAVDPVPRRAQLGFGHQDLAADTG